MIIYPYPAGPSRPTIASVQKAVANHYGLSVDDLKSPSRLRRIVHPKQVAMYLAHNICRRSVSDIGRAFWRDHSTVIFGLKAIEERLTSPELGKDVDEITRSIGNV